jgi:hypothetical protein
MCSRDPYRLLWTPTSARYRIEASDPGMTKWRYVVTGLPRCRKAPPRNDMACRLSF